MRRKAGPICTSSCTIGRPEACRTTRLRLQELQSYLCLVGIKIARLFKNFFMTDGNTNASIWNFKSQTKSAISVVGLHYKSIAKAVQKLMQMHLQMQSKCIHTRVHARARHLHLRKIRYLQGEIPPTWSAKTPVLDYSVLEKPSWLASGLKKNEQVPLSANGLKPKATRWGYSRQSSLRATKT